MSPDRLGSKKRVSRDTPGNRALYTNLSDILDSDISSSSVGCDRECLLCSNSNCNLTLARIVSLDSGLILYKSEKKKKKITFLILRNNLVYYRFKILFLGKILYLWIRTSLSNEKLIYEYFA